jgi:hypothetical protein
MYILPRSLLLVLAGACGPAVPTDTSEGSGDTGADTSSSSAPTTTDGAAPGDTGASAATTAALTTSGVTGDVSTTETTVDPTTTDADLTTTGDSSTSGDSTTSDETSTGAADGVQITAEYVIGQVNRIMVYRADFDADLCAILRLAEGVDDPDPTLTLPPPWYIEWAQVSQGVARCLGGEPSMSWEQPDGMKGAIDFDPVMPCVLDIDVTASFPPSRPWVPAEVHFMASGVAIEGFC